MVLGYYNHSRAKFDKAVDMYKKAEKLGIYKPNYLLSYGVLMLREEILKKPKNCLVRF